MNDKVRPQLRDAQSDGRVCFPSVKLSFSLTRRILVIGTIVLHDILYFFSNINIKNGSSGESVGPNPQFSI